VLLGGKLQLQATWVVHGAGLGSPALQRLPHVQFHSGSPCVVRLQLMGGWLWYEPVDS